MAFCVTVKIFSLSIRCTYPVSAIRERERERLYSWPTCDGQGLVFSA